ncbi:LYR motif-containing protein 4 [Phlebotomus papatasi]|uniref:Complex 1 LYR protein domain-containing protein n=1 Tax=Phlebotomus papatasi TaxID=29031 RepID=A0A1B0D317_PHLPP|nr:LYR motif-containing protein 4 [Phlebotomus papatasi]
MSSKSKVLSLYKTMLRESQKFSSYNYREYARRRIKDAFRDNKDLSDAQSIQNQLKYADENLQVIRRQALIGDLYKTDRLVIEK